MEARIVSFPTSHPGVRVAGDRIEVERVTLHDGPLAAWLAAQPPDDHSDPGRARGSHRADRAAERRRDAQRGRRARRVRPLRGPEPRGERARRRGARGRPARELRGRRWATAADARVVPGRPRQAPRDGRGAVRPEAAGLRRRADRLDARDVLRRRCLATRGPPRPDAARVAAPPVPDGGRGRLPRPPGEARRHRGGPAGARRRASEVGGEGRRLRGDPRADARRGGPRAWRPARALRQRRRRRRPLEEGRLRADAGPGPLPRRRAPGRHRGQGPQGLRPRDAR